MRLSEVKTRKRPDKYPTELYVDVLDRETIRVQLRNLSLWFCDSDFIQFTKLLQDAKERLVDMRSKELARKTKKTIPLDNIENNTGHTAEPDKEHRDGIDKVKLLILQCKKITPILVKETPAGYERLDGYKRYKAFEELGYKAIECYVDNDAPYGGQAGVPWVLYGGE